MFKNILIFLTSTTVLILFLMFAIDRLIYQMDIEEEAAKQYLAELQK